MGTGGAARAGCMGFSLIGVLMSVGLVVWLGSQAFDGATGPANRAGQHQLSTTTGAPQRIVEVVTDPSTGLTDDMSITVSASNLHPGEKVMVVACSATTDRLPGDVGSCDTATEMSTTASAAGNIEVRFAMPRVLRASGLPIDCAADAGGCEVQVMGLDSAAVGRTSVSFAEGLPSPDLRTDLGG